MKPHILTSATVLIALASISLAQKTKLSEPGIGLTVYNNNFAVVKERRLIEFEEKTDMVKFTDVASEIDPTSVNFECLSAPGAITILEQNYEYDLVNTAGLLERYVDETVTVVVSGSGADVGREISGVLLASMDDSLILRTETGDIEIISRAGIEQIQLEKLPQDLADRPTLVWLAESKQQGKLLCQVTYTTSQIGWSANYSAILNADETGIDLNGYVTIDNKSGADYKDAAIKLIAGEVHRIIEKPPRYRKKLYAMEAGRPREAGFEEKPFMEYHLYTLGRKSTIKNNQDKQIELIEPASEVPVKKLYIYDRQQKTDKVQTKFEFENTKKNHLGIALPKGKVRVFKRDPDDGMLEFVGEDKIVHTADKEKISLYIADAFDIVPEYTLVDSKRTRRMHRQTHKIELRNRKNTPLTVYVDEKFPAWVNWRIDDSTHKHQKRDARTARFEIKLGPDSTVTLTYTATQTW